MKQNQMSNLGLIFGIVGLIVFPYLFGIAGIVLGAIGMSRGEPKGKTAVIVSVLATVLGFVVQMYMFDSF